MKTKELLKRIYYALTSVALFIVLLDWTPMQGITHRKYYCLSLGFNGALLVLGIAVFCWLMSKYNGNRTRKWYIGGGVIGLYISWALIVELLRWWAASRKVFINVYAIDIAFFLLLMLYMAIVIFCSKTKYDNILPIHNKVILQALKWLFIIAQIAVWVRFVWILPGFIFEWWQWPNEAAITEKFDSMNEEFNKVFGEDIKEIVPIDSLSR